MVVFNLQLIQVEFLIVQQQQTPSKICTTGGELKECAPTQLCGGHTTGLCTTMPSVSSAVQCSYSTSNTRTIAQDSPEQQDTAARTFARTGCSPHHQSGRRGEEHGQIEHQNRQPHERLYNKRTTNKNKRRAMNLNVLLSTIRFRSGGKASPAKNATIDITKYINKYSSSFNQQNRSKNSNEHSSSI